MSSSNREKNILGFSPGLFDRLASLSMMSLSSENAGNSVFETWSDENPRFLGWRKLQMMDYRAQLLSA